MPTFVELTRVFSTDKACVVWVNLDQVRSIRRLPALPATEYCKALPERTRLEFAVAVDGPDASDKYMDVQEPPAEISAKGREESGWCR